MYEQYNPSKLRDVPGLLKKCVGCCRTHASRMPRPCRARLACPGGRHARTHARTAHGPRPTQHPPARLALHALRVLRVLRARARCPRRRPLAPPLVAPGCGRYAAYCGRRYAGQEQQLLAGIIGKYGPEPPPKPVGGAGGGYTPPSLG